MAQNFHFFKTCILEPNLNIDEGRIVKLSNRINIKYKSLFNIILEGYLSQNKIINSTNFQKLKKEFPKKTLQKKSRHTLFQIKPMIFFLKTRRFLH